MGVADRAPSDVRGDEFLVLSYLVVKQPGHTATININELLDMRNEGWVLRSEVSNGNLILRMEKEKADGHS